MRRADSWGPPSCAQPARKRRGSACPAAAFRREAEEMAVYPRLFRELRVLSQLGCVFVFIQLKITEVQRVGGNVCTNATA